MIFYSEMMLPKNSSFPSENPLLLQKLGLLVMNRMKRNGFVISILNVLLRLYPFSS